MQTALAILIVVVAAAYVLRVFYKSFYQKKGCNCACTGCDMADSCSEPRSDDSGNRSAGQNDSSVP